MRRLATVSLTIWVLGITAAWAWARVEFPKETLSLGLVEIMFLGLGAYLSLRVRGNLLGPCLLLGASAGLSYDVGTAYAVFSLGSDLALPLEHFAGWVGTWIGPIGFLTIPTLFVIFPEGRFVGRQRWFIPVLSVPAVLTAIGAFAVSTASTPDLVATSTGAQDIPGYVWIDAAFGVSLLLAIPAAITLLIRFWRTDSVRRQQIKWLAASAIVAPTLIFSIARLFPTVPEIVTFTVGLSTIPLAIGVAVTRHRLYDLGRLVSRTVTYSIVVGFLGSIFAMAVVVVPGRIYDAAPSWLVAVSTLGVAAFFNPLRRRVQVWVDGRFNRSHYDAQRLSDAFTESLRDRVDAELVVDDWIDVVSAAMQPQSLGVWVRQ